MARKEEMRKRVLPRKRIITPTMRDSNRILRRLLRPTVMLGLGGDKCRPSEAKGSSHTGLLVTRTCTRTSWQVSRVQGKGQRALLSRAETYRGKENSDDGVYS